MAKKSEKFKPMTFFEEPEPGKSEQEIMIADIRERLSNGDELRDVAKSYGMSCRAICRLVS